ncbi:hypothetical protein [Brevundimonas denitrificans]|nr:hypothetical protein [Brevundimonas denitrificans]
MTLALLIALLAKTSLIAGVGLLLAASPPAARWSGSTSCAEPS